MSVKKYDKLVRDKIPEIIFNTGKKAKVYIANEIEYSAHLKKKLQEEVMEFVENPCAEEAADIMEILHFILGREGITDAQVMTASVVNRIERGGFNMCYFLEWVEE